MTDGINPQLIAIATELAEGGQPQPVTARTMLSWFNAQRRRYRISQHIRSQLLAAGLTTDPDFQGSWIDTPLNFYLISSIADAGEEEAPDMEAQNQPEAATLMWVSREATFKIGRLDAANQGIVSIAPDKTLQEAVTIMMARGFSQIPVMSNERDVKGMLSWRSIGSRLALKSEAQFARDAMENHTEVKADVSLFNAIQLIVENDYVLVRGSDNKVTGIVTASDLSAQFHDMTEPFLLLSEIENLIRNLIGNSFSSDELKAACDGGRDPARADSIATIADLTFGEYQILLQEPGRWGKIDLAVDRAIFCQNLDGVRQIRNDVMHFDPEGIEPEDLYRLREFAKFMREILQIRGKR